MPQPDFSLPPFLVYIVESNRPQEWISGRCEGVALSQVLQFSDVRGRLERVSTKAQLQFVLANAHAWMRHSHLWPIIHISAHGSDSGIELNSGLAQEFVPWRELAQMLSTLHIGTNGSYLLCMSSCKGLAAVRLSLSNGAYPTFGVVGTLDDVDWSDNVIGFAAFYHLLKKGKTIAEAIKGMNNASGHGKYMFVHGPSFIQTLQENLREQARL